MEPDDVASWYENILGREADTGGLQYWQSMIDAGADPSVVQQAFFNAAADELQGDDSALDPVTDAWDERRLVDSMKLFYEPQQFEGGQTTPLANLQNQSFYDYQSGFSDFSRPANERLGGFDITQYTADAYVEPTFGQQAAADYIAKSTPTSIAPWYSNAPSGNAPSYISALRSNRSNVSAAPYSYQRTNVGAADGQMMGAGTEPYASQLIQALRQSSAQPFSTNRGIDLTSITGGPGQANAINLQSLPSTRSLAFNPQRANVSPMQNGASGPALLNTPTVNAPTNQSVFGESSDGAASLVGGGPMTTNQAMNAIALGSGLSNYGSTIVAPGAFAAGLLGNAMMGAGQNALSSLDAAMLGMSPGDTGGGYGSGAGWGGGIEGSGLGY